MVVSCNEFQDVAVHELASPTYVAVVFTFGGAWWNHGELLSCGQYFNLTSMFSFENQLFALMLEEVIYLMVGGMDEQAVVLTGA